MAGARFVDPKILARIGNLELLARNVVDGFINGLHRAPFFGASVDFAEHRGYVAGDDIRRVDWKLYAQAFDSAGALDQLEGFASFHGADFYGLPRNRGTITLRRESWTVPESFAFGEAQLKPLGGGEALPWRMV